MKNLNLYGLIYLGICSNLVNQDKHCNLYYDLAALCLNKDQGGTYTLETEIACRGGMAAYMEPIDHIFLCQ